MGYIRVRPDGISSINSKISGIKNKNAECISEIAKVRNNLDWEILSKSSINAKLYNLNTRMNRQRDILNSYNDILTSVVNDFGATDRKLKQDAQNILYQLNKLIATGAALGVINSEAGFKANNALQNIDRINGLFNKESAKKGTTYILDYLGKVVMKSGYIGSIASFISGLNKVSGGKSVGSILAQGAKVGFSAIKDVVAFKKEFENLGKVKRMLHPDTIKTGWKNRVFGLTDAMKGGASKASNIGVKFSRNFNKSGDGVLDAYKGVKGAGKAAVAWAGVALSGAVNFFDNREEYKDKKGKDGRIWAETITETAFDTAKNVVVGAVVTAGIATAAGSAPVLAVAAGTIFIGTGLDHISKALTGENMTEAVSDMILDGGTAVAKATKDAFNSIANCFTNAKKSIGANWRQKFSF